MSRLLLASLMVLWSSIASAQAVSERGFVEGRYFVFPQVATNDAERQIGDVLYREEVFVKPAKWLQFATGFDFRINSHHQVEHEWRLDVEDRGIRRPRTAIRRLSATVTAGNFSLDVGKQFIRWGRADIINPTDRFAPRDFVNVIDTEFLPVLGVRPTFQIGSETFEAVWVPRFTPSRMPLFDQRWTVLPPEAAGLVVVDAGSRFPKRAQQGVRWRHTGGRFESALSVFDGFNHLPNIEVVVPPGSGLLELTRVFPRIRTYGADVAIPAAWFTLKGEASYVTTPSSNSEEYVLYVIEIERQKGEWLLDIGYAGDMVTDASDELTFAPDRGMARSIVARASYTVNPRSTVTFEGAVRQDGDGRYGKFEYTAAMGQHWRFTATAVNIGGNEGDFLGQYHRNSHFSMGLRVSF